MRLKPGVPFEPEKFRRAIKSAGQQAGGFELRLRAAVERRDGRYYLRPVELAQQFGVRGGSSTDKLGPFVGKRVRARGKLVSPGPPLELELSETAPP